MKERLMTWVLGALALGTGCSNVGPAWTYAGAEGPASWGTLDPTFAACGSGRSQSPVNIVEVLPRDLPNLAFKYGTAPVRLRNNGRAIEQAFDPGQSVAIGNKRYELQSLTLHTPSEHRAAGRTFPIELQLLHKSAQGHLLVISVMVKEGIITAAALAGILNHLPPTAGDTYESERPLPLVQLLPAQRTYMRYSGSLTTPPCWENVMRVVLTEPISASKAHLQALGAILPNNVRPLAPLGRRTVFLDATP